MGEGMTFCLHCGKPVDPDDRNTYQLVTGWERRRRDGGTNQLALRQTAEKYSHRHCIDLLKRDISPHQGTLI